MKKVQNEKTLLSSLYRNFYLRFVSLLAKKKKSSLIIENLYIQYCSNTVNLLQQNQLFPSLNTYTVTRKRT